MDESISRTAPFFDATALGRELAACIAREGGASAARPAVLERLKRLVSEARAEACRQLLIDGRGRRCAEALGVFQDALIRLVYDYTVRHCYQATNPSDA